MAQRRGFERLLSNLDDSDAKSVMWRVRKDLETKQSTVDTVNGLITAGTFIAGVQAQSLSFTFGNNDTSLAVAANWFGFVGLTLDIVGACGGILHAILLQRSIRRTQELMAHVAGRVKAARDLLGPADRDIDAVLRHEPDMVDSLRLMEGKIRELTGEDDRNRQWADSWARNDEKDDSAVQGGQPREGEHSTSQRRAARSAFSGAFQGLPPLNPFDAWLHWNEVVQVALQEFRIFILRAAADPTESSRPLPTHTLGQVPIGVMGWGIICLLISVLLFAASTQHRAVWVSCVVLTCIAASGMVSGFDEDPYRRKRDALIQEIIGKLPNATSYDHEGQGSGRQQAEAGIDRMHYAVPSVSPVLHASETSV